MSRSGRILVVDDLQRWRDEVEEHLSQAGFHVDLAATISEARDLLRRTFYHLIVLDIRMNDGDQTNVAGMELLDALNQLSLDSALEIIMLSAYGTREQMRKAFAKYSVADFIDKDDFDNFEFLELVHQTFTEKVRVNFDLKFHWQEVDGPEEAVPGLKVDQRCVEADPAFQARIATELDDLLCRLFYQAESIMVKPMAPGFSSTGVLWVRPFYADGGGQAVAAKFGDFRKIDTEYKNYQEYVRPFVGGGRSTRVEDLRRTTHLGGILYSFLGTANGQLEDFGAFYRRAGLAQIKAVIKHLFRETCRAWYASLGRLQPVDLTADYQDLLGFDSEVLAQIISQEMPSVQGKEKLTFASLGNGRSFTNPVLAAADRPLVRPTYRCITHGDFNERNILVDQMDQTWLIDFQHTGRGHMLRDIVKLDSVVRIELLLDQEATLAERLQLEEALCRIETFGQVEQLAANLPTENPALAKAYQVILFLRTLAHKLLPHNASDDFSQYHIAALYQALKALNYRTLRPVQREHALLSAALLAERLGL